MTKRYIWKCLRGLLPYLKSLLLGAPRIVYGKILARIKVVPGCSRQDFWVPINTRVRSKTKSSLPTPQAKKSPGFGGEFINEILIPQNITALFSRIHVLQPQNRAVLPTGERPIGGNLCFMQCLTASQMNGTLP